MAPASIPVLDRLQAEQQQYPEGGHLQVPSTDWQRGPLWSLLDMLSFKLDAFATALMGIDNAVTSIGLRVMAGSRHPPDASTLRNESVAAETKEALQTFYEMCESTPSLFSRTLIRKVARIRDGVDLTHQLAVGGTVASLRELRADIVSELGEHLFLRMPGDKADTFTAGPDAWGAYVRDANPEAAEDIAAASRCYALDEWTACVFHLMRVLEHGLRRLAERVELPGDAMAHENWGSILDRIEKKIREFDAKPKSSEKSDALKQYSSMAVQFRYFKDAWRNHAMHSRSHYDERQATDILNHVRQFMQQLSPSD